MKISIGLCSFLGLMLIFIALTMGGLAETRPFPSPAVGFQENVADENIVTESILRELHVFHGMDGKTVKGRIRAYDPESETVTKAKQPWNTVPNKPPPYPYSLRGGTTIGRDLRPTATSIPAGIHWPQ